MNEQDYIRGKQQAWIAMLRQCLKELGHDNPSIQCAQLVMERAEAVLALRRVCERHGDNDWPDDLHLADVIDKHLRCPEVTA